MFRLYTMLFAPAGDDGGQGGGGGAGLMGGAPPAGGQSAPPATPPVQGGSQEPPASILGDDGNFTSQWYQGNEDLTPYGKSLDKFTTPAALAKSYGILERNRAVPAEGAEADAIEAFRKVNGIPQNHAEYDLKMPENLPEGVTLNDEGLAAYKEAFHNLNITPYQAQGLMEKHIELTGQSVSDMQGQAYNNQQEAAANLQKEWGTAYDANLEKAQSAFDGLCAKAGVNPDELSFTSDPAFAKIMAAVANSTSESPIIGGGGQGGIPKGGKSEAHEIMTNKNHPDYAAFYDPQDARHNEIQDRVARLNK